VCLSCFGWFVVTGGVSDANYGDVWSIGWCPAGSYKPTTYSVSTCMHYIHLYHTLKLRVNEKSTLILVLMIYVNYVYEQVQRVVLVPIHWKEPLHVYT
jgi:hypothetical protein